MLDYYSNVDLILSDSRYAICALLCALCMMQCVHVLGVGFYRQ
jgi:hypothetical protein